MEHGAHFLILYYPPVSLVAGRGKTGAGKSSPAAGGRLLSLCVRLLLLPLGVREIHVGQLLVDVEHLAAVLCACASPSRKMPSLAELIVAQSRD